jgi:hypothetical protein
LYEKIHDLSPLDPGLRILEQHAALAIPRAHLLADADRVLEDRIMSRRSPSAGAARTRSKALRRQERVGPEEILHPSSRHVSLLHRGFGGNAGKTIRQQRARAGVGHAD